MWEIFDTNKVETWFKGFHLYAFETTTEPKNFSPEGWTYVPSFLMSKRVSWLSLTGTHNIHSFSGTIIHIFLNISMYFYKSKISLGNFCEIISYFTWEPFEVSGSFELESAPWVRNQKRNGAKTKLSKHVEWGFPIYNVSQRAELRNCSNDRILQGKRKIIPKCGQKLVKKRKSVI